VYNLYQLFHTRFSLHKTVYTHRVSKAVEYMICDAMHLADPILNISAAIDDPERYAMLTDGIIREIERSQCPELEEARLVLRRLRRRDLYKMAVDHLVQPEDYKVIDEVSEESLVKCQPPPIYTAEGLSVDDVIVHKLTTNYGDKNRNPVDKVSFYRHEQAVDLFHIPRDKVGTILPARFEEKTIRVYCRNPDKVLLDSFAHSLRVALNAPIVVNGESLKEFSERLR